MNKSPSISSSLRPRLLLICLSVLRLTLSGCLTGGVGIISVKQRPVALGSGGDVGGCSPTSFLLPHQPEAFAVICCFLNSKTGFSLLCCAVAPLRVGVCLLEGLPSLPLEEPLSSGRHLWLGVSWSGGSVGGAGHPLEPYGVLRRLLGKGTCPRPGHLGAGAPGTTPWALSPPSLPLGLCGSGPVLSTPSLGRVAGSKNVFWVEPDMPGMVLRVTVYVAGFPQVGPTGIPPGLRGRFRVGKQVPPVRWRQGRGQALWRCPGRLQVLG